MGKKEEYENKILKAIDNIEPQEQIVNLHEIIKQVSNATDIDLSTIRKNKDYYNLCVNGFKKHIYMQYINENNIINDQNDNDLNQTIQKLENKIDLLETILSQKINNEEYRNLIDLAHSVHELIENNDNILIKDTKIYYKNRMLIDNPLVFKYLLPNDKKD